MPPLPAVANTLKCQLLWSDSADANVRTTLYFRYTGGPPSATDCNALAADIYGAAANMLTQWTATTQLTGVEITDLGSATGATGLHAQSTSGTRAGQDLAGGTAVVVGYVIARRYRGGKPRSYFPWFDSSDLATRQTWAAGNVTACDGFLATFFAACLGFTSGTTAITEHVNVSYYDGFTVVTSPTTGRARNVPTRRTTPLTDIITSFGTRTQPGSQRRRNR
jgi:hypothetical protein